MDRKKKDRQTDKNKYRRGTIDAFSSGVNSNPICIMSTYFSEFSADTSSILHIMHPINTKYFQSHRENAEKPCYR